MTLRVSVSGLKELEASLGELSKGAAKGALRRILIKAGEPIAAAARQNAPVETGELQRSIIVGTKVVNDTGKKEFADVMKAGGTKLEAVGALRAARRASGEDSFAIAYVGPTKARNKADAIKRIVQEFGSRLISGHPYMRPAWDSMKMQALEIIKRDLGAEIMKTAARAAKRALLKQARIAKGK